MAITWDIVGTHRLDLVAWSKPDMVARKSVVQLFPGGRQGSIQAADLSSVVIRAQLGTRVTLMTETGPRWWAHPWRCIRFIPGHVVPSGRRTGLPGVRIPDLDRLDPVNAKRTDRELESSYPIVAAPSDGTGWTFGAIGHPELKGNIQAIRVEWDEAPQPEAATDTPHSPAAPPATAQHASAQQASAAPPQADDAPTAVPRHRVVPLDYDSPTELAAALDEVVQPGEHIISLLPQPAGTARSQVWAVLQRRLAD